MLDQVRLARVGDQLSQLVGNAQPPFRGRQQHHASIGCETPTVERGDDFLALHGWKSERQEDIFGHGGGGSRDRVDCWVVTPNSVNEIRSLHLTRQRIPAMSPHKTG